MITAARDFNTNRIVDHIVLMRCDSARAVDAIGRNQLYKRRVMSSTLVIRAWWTIHHCGYTVVAQQDEATAKGFEPLRAEPNGFLVHHLNHSVTLSRWSCKSMQYNTHTPMLSTYKLHRHNLCTHLLRQEPFKFEMKTFSFAAP